MELDDLKAAWKDNTQQTAKKLLNEEELLAMLHRKASNTIDLLKKSVRFELWFTVLFMVVAVVVGFKTGDPVLRDISLIALLISCGFGFYYYKKLSLLNKLTVENTSIKENLTHLLAQFEKFIWFYRWGSNFLLPIALFAGAFGGLYVSTEKDFIDVISQIKLWAILLVIFVPITFLFNVGMKWYLKKLYGNHLSHLRFLLQELED